MFKYKFTDITHVVLQLLYHNLKFMKKATLETLLHYIWTYGQRTNPYTSKRYTEKSFFSKVPLCWVAGKEVTH